MLIFLRRVHIRFLGMLEVFLLLSYKLFYLYFDKWPICARSNFAKKDLLKVHQNTKNTLYEQYTSNNASTITKIQIAKQDFDFISHLASILVLSNKTSDYNYEHGLILFSFFSDFLRKNPSKHITCLEIGTAKGFSSSILSSLLCGEGRSGNVFTIDPIHSERPIFWNSLSDSNGKKSRVELMKSAGLKNNIMDKITFLRGTSSDILNRLSLSSIDFAFIDGLHTYSAVKAELQYVAIRQNKGGKIILDDFNSNMFDGVVKAVNEFCLLRDYECDIVDFVLDESRKLVIMTKI